MQKVTVSFDKEQHKYTDNLGREYISVTQLIQAGEPEFDARAIAEKVSNTPSSKYYRIPVADIVMQWEQSAPIGTALHEAVECYINEKKISENSVIKPCVEQFAKLKFKGKLLSETLVFSEEYLVAGTVDLIEDMGDTLFLYDIKTSVTDKNRELSPSKKKHYTLQLNLYKYLIEAQLQKPCQIIGILWFKNYAGDKEKTKLTIVPIKENRRIVDETLRRRKLLM